MGLVGFHVGRDDGEQDPPAAEPQDRVPRADLREYLVISTQQDI